MPFSCIKSAMTSQFCEVSKKNSFRLAPPQHSYIKNKQTTKKLLNISKELQKLHKHKDIW